MKKIIALLFVVLFAVGLLSGCNRSKCLDNGDMKTIKSGTTGEYFEYYIFYDPQTKVEYITYYRGGTSPLYNSDGTLKLYTDDEP